MSLGNPFHPLSNATKDTQVKNLCPFLTSYEQYTQFKSPGKLTSAKVMWAIYLTYDPESALRVYDWDDKLTRMLKLIDLSPKDKDAEILLLALDSDYPADNLDIEEQNQYRIYNISGGLDVVKLVKLYFNLLDWKYDTFITSQKQLKDANEKLRIGKLSPKQSKDLQEVRQNAIIQYESVRKVWQENDADKIIATLKLEVDGVTTKREQSAATTKLKRGGKVGSFSVSQMTDDDIANL